MVNQEYVCTMFRNYASKISFLTTGLALCALTVSLVGGCSRTFESKTPTGTALADLDTPVNVQVALMEGGALLTWSIADASGVSSYRIYVSEDGENGEYRSVANVTGFSHTLTGLVNGRQVFARIAAVSEVGFEGDRSSAVPILPGAMSMLISNDAEYVNRRSVALNFFLSQGGALTVRLSEDSLFTNANWSVYSPLKNFTLSEGDGVKWVYADVQFADGATLAGPLSDSVTLDSRAEIDSVRNDAGGAVLSLGDTVTFTVAAGETDGEANVRFGSQSLELFDDGTNGDVVADDSIYSRRYVIPSNLEITDAQIIGLFTDRAGNVADQAIDVTLLNVANTPQPVTLSGLATSSSEVRLQWTVSQAQDFSNYRLHRDISAAVTETSQLIATVTSRTATTFTDNELNDNTTYYYRLYVYDNTNLTAGSNVLSAVTLINQPPTAVSLGGKIDSLDAVLTWSLNDDDDFKSYNVYRSISSGFSPAPHLLVGIINSQATTEFRIENTAGSFFYKVVVFDLQGASAESNEIGL